MEEVRLMTEQAIKRKREAEVDWEELILEIQTAPVDGLTESHGILYDAIYGLITVRAQQWLENHHLAQAHDGALTAIGIDKIFKEISKFTIPEDASAGIRKAFIAWALKCSEREWSRPKYQLTQTEISIAPDTIEETYQSTSPSPEEVLITEVSSITPVSRSVTEKALKLRILEEELNKLQPAMKEALLESEDLKSVENPNARGKQGEAASIATKHGYKPGAIRTCRNRLLKKVLERFEQEVKA